MSIEDPPSHDVYIGLGANIGDPLAMIRQTISLIDEIPHVAICNVSSLWKTSPVGYADQPDFLNAVLACRSSLDFEQLYDATSHLEQTMGKKKICAHGPRVIDIDLVYVPQQSYHSARLIIPHPRMCERLFVLLPLYEVLDSHTLFIPDGSSSSSIMKKVDISAIISALRKQSGQHAHIYLEQQSQWWRSRS